VIEIQISLGIDKKTIIDLLPQFKGQLKFTVAAKAPANAIEVTPVPFGAPPPPPAQAQKQAPGSPATTEPQGGLKKNPPGLIGPTRLDGLVTPSYQQIPVPPPGEGTEGGQPIL
jgi:hypothetical protein